MATLVTRLQDLTTRIATEFKSHKLLINGNQADLSALQTDAKTSLVAAVNELHQDIIDAVTASGAQIDDAATTSSSETYSITKILSLLAGLKNEILGGAGAAYDTLQEIKAYIDSADGGVLTALGKRVAVDQAQTFTTGEKLQARQNIGADITSTEIGNPDTNFVTTFNDGLV